MRNIAICGDNVKGELPGKYPVETIEIHGVAVNCGTVVTQDTAFDARAFQNRSKLLVRVRAFSCNYRDLSLLFSAAQNVSEGSFWTLGSEFVGEVVELGSEVTGFAVGDRVVGNNNFSGVASFGASPRQGIPTNNASREYQIFDEASLMKIPRNMPDRVAAGFSLGAQTAYSMLRKLSLTEGARVLVTAAKSNTSLFAINALRKYNVNLYATSTSMQFERELKEMGVKELILLKPGRESFDPQARLQAVVEEVGRFDFVIDPFFDVHLGEVTKVMVPGGTYITCGLGEQNQHQKVSQAGPGPKSGLLTAIANNLRIIGNCLGLTEDLAAALRDYETGSLSVTIDSVFSGNRVGGFLDRTYNRRDRFGKVTFEYA